MDTAAMRQLQVAATRESKHGIPLIFARDVIHGLRQYFQFPWLKRPAGILIWSGKEVGSPMELVSVGIRWTFAPMLDICQDSRWGRIAESPGEDPYLAKKLSAAYIQGFQGENLADPTRIAACAKHFIAYGAAIGGRDYNSAHSQ